jgi:hypothetical protein
LKKVLCEIDIHKKVFIVIVVAVQVVVVIVVVIVVVGCSSQKEIKVRWKNLKILLSLSIVLNLLKNTNDRRDHIYAI